MIVLLLLTFLHQAKAQPLCTFAYSPCDPQDVNTGVCVDAPGQTCYQDASNVVYCCVPPPTGPATTTTLAPCAPAPPAPAPVAPAPAPVPAPAPTSSFTGICADVMPCCNTNYCSAYRNEMMKICPLTCGFCVGVPGASTSLSLLGCSDSVTTCRQQASLCTLDNHRDLMRWQCTYTCGYCNSCVDHSLKCATWAQNGFCTKSYYTVDQIRSFCARTCGYCGTLTTSVAANCFDNDSSCPTWVKNNFCSSIYYTTEQKKQYCARSCNLC